MSKWDRLLDLYAEVDSDLYWAHLRESGSRLVMGDGEATAEAARIFIIGEAPGATENGAGRPFVGASGKVLGMLLDSIGIRRSDCFITNVVKYRPPGNRTPNLPEVLRGTETLRIEWSIVRPTLTLALGVTAHTALGTNVFIRPRHGELQPLGKTPGHWVASLYHPAYGLRGKTGQRLIEEEWAILEEGIEATCPDLLTSRQS